MYNFYEFHRAGQADRGQLFVDRGGPSLKPRFANSPMSRSGASAPHYQWMGESQPLPLEKGRL